MRTPPLATGIALVVIGGVKVYFPWDRYTEKLVSQSSQETSWLLSGETVYQSQVESSWEMDGEFWCLMSSPEPLELIVAKDLSTEFLRYVS